MEHEKPLRSLILRLPSLRRPDRSLLAGASNYSFRRVNESTHTAALLPASGQLRYDAGSKSDIFLICLHKSQPTDCTGSLLNRGRSRDTAASTGTACL